MQSNIAAAGDHDGHGKQVTPGNQEIMNAMLLLKELPNTIRRNAFASNQSAARKAELKIWIRDHEAEIHNRRARLSKYIGRNLDPAKHAKLRHLLQPMEASGEDANPEDKASRKGNSATEGAEAEED